ncbi:MAG: hypothetical protein V1655_01730 [bacterium]
MNYDKIHKTIRWLLAGTVILAFLFLVNEKLVLWGNFEVEYNFSKKFHPFISCLRPDDRVGEKSDGTDGFFYYHIEGEPVYFDIEAPSNFNKVNLELEYKIPSSNENFSDFKAGVLVDKAMWQYKLEPLENRKLDNLSNDWHSIKEGDTIFLQGIRKYNSIDEFLNNLPPVNEYAVYNYNLDNYNNLSFTGYEKNNEYRELGFSLQGRHQFYTYIDNEPLDFIFDFSLNESKDKEKTLTNKAEINVYYRNELVRREEIIKDGNFLNEIKILENGLQKGVYKIEIVIPDEIIITKIKTKQNFLTFINKIYLANLAGNYNNVSLYTNSPSLKISASEGDSLQNIKIADKVYKINELYKEFNLNGFSCVDYKYLGQSNCLSRAQLEKDNLLAQGAGLFSFSQDEFLDPEIKSLDKIENFSNLYYVIASYSSPEKLEAGWFRNNVSFNISSVIRDKRKYNFILSAKGINSKYPIYIRKIKAVFE